MQRKQVRYVTLRQNLLGHIAVLWCALFHRKHHVHNKPLRMIFCQKCDPQADKKAKRSRALLRLGSNNRLLKRLKKGDF